MVPGDRVLHLRCRVRPVQVASGRAASDPEHALGRTGPAVRARSRSVLRPMRAVGSPQMARCRPASVPSCGLRPDAGAALPASVACRGAVGRERPRNRPRSGLHDRPRTRRSCPVAGAFQGAGRGRTGGSRPTTTRVMNHRNPAAAPAATEDPGRTAPTMERPRTTRPASRVLRARRGASRGRRWRASPGEAERVTTGGQRVRFPARGAG